MFLNICLLILLIFINGILSASEIAFLSIDKYDLTRKRNKKAKKVLKLLEDESKFLSTIQIGITLAGFLASASASDTFVNFLIDNGAFIFSESFTRSFLLVLITLILSYITLVFGELVPKKIGRSNPIKVAYVTVDLLQVIKTIFYPLIKLLTWSTERICKIFKIKERDDSLTEKDIKKMIITGSKEGIVLEKEKEYILNIFEFKDKSARKIMTPRDQVISIDINDNKTKILNIIKKNRYTRFPVLDKDKVLGFINIKDFVYYHKLNANLEIKNLIHPVMKFKSNEKIDDIFRIMQENNETFSVVLHNENFVGILTMEDAIEEIVGSIKDEYN